MHQTVTTMRNLFLSFFFLFFSVLAFSQNNPVSWSFELTQGDDGTYILAATADIEAGWYVYSQQLDGDGPVPTQLTVEHQEGVTILGEATEEGNKVSGYDEIFGMDIVKFKKKATFSRKLRLQESVQSVTGSILFMCCNDEQCLPPRDVPFSVTVE